MPSVAAWPDNTTTPQQFLHLTETLHHEPRRIKAVRRQSQQSSLAKFATTHVQRVELKRRESEESAPDETAVDQLRDQLDRTLAPTSADHTNDQSSSKPSIPRQQSRSIASVPEASSPTQALNDTPTSSAPTSPGISGGRLPPANISAPVTLGIPMKAPSSAGSTPRIRPTTLDIPGLTKSKVSPDGKIAKRDVGAKLVIVMVGLPARGKSYITKKLARYLNWLQHDTRIFNVGERRRVAAHGPFSPERSRTRPSHAPSDRVNPLNLDSPAIEHSEHASHILLNDDTEIEAPATPENLRATPSNTLNRVLSNCEAQGGDERDLYQPDMGEPTSPIISKRKLSKGASAMEQDATFFDPENQKASRIREQLARETLDELLDYILEGNGSVGILDATNSTMERRKMVMDRIRERAGPDLNVLFLESRCVDQDLLEANMRLKLSGPDYKDMDPNVALADFKKRVEAYEKAYVPLGEYEERHNMPYIQMIDVGRKIISHQIRGFLMAQANYYLLNFNLAPRQIWITRHGLSLDNVSGKIGGDSELAPEGHEYAKSLVPFMDKMRKEWDVRQLNILSNSHFPPQPGDVTPPNPHYHCQSPESVSDGGSTTSEGTDGNEIPTPAFCVWTSMLKRSIETAQYFNDEEYDVKQMRMLDELNAGTMEGLTYRSISSAYPDEYALRKSDKLHYRYPGPGGEGYLDIINRLRPVIVELERMTDNVLLIGHRSVARVLLAYFRGLRREEVADLDVPIGMLYCLEPKPYGVDFKAYKWDKETKWFYEQPDFQLKAALDDMQ